MECVYLNENNFFELTELELFEIDGGKKTTSDYLLLGGSICLCFVSPWVGVPATIGIFVLT